MVFHFIILSSFYFNFFLYNLNYIFYYILKKNFLNIFSIFFFINLSFNFSINFYSFDFFNFFFFNKIFTNLINEVFTNASLNFRFFLYFNNNFFVTFYTNVFFNKIQSYFIYYFNVENLFFIFFVFFVFLCIFYVKKTYFKLN